MLSLIIYGSTLLILSFFLKGYYDEKKSDFDNKNFYFVTLISFCNIFYRNGALGALSGP